MTLYHESGLDAVLSDALVIQGVQHYIYGDAAYLVRPWLQASFRGVMTPNEEACNETMKVPRAAIEWGFRDVKQVCAFLDFPSKLKILEGPVGLFYRAGALIWKLHCCAYGSATTDFFKCPPPSWEVYLGSLPRKGAAADSASGEESGPSARPVQASALAFSIAEISEKMVPTWCFLNGARVAAVQSEWS